VPGADFYEIYVSEITSETIPTEEPFTLGGTWLDANQICAGDICKVRYIYREIPLNNFNYRWYVRSYDRETNTLTEWAAAQMEFSINVPPPAPPTPLSVSPVVYAPTTGSRNNVPFSVNYHQITVEWLPTPNVSHYRLYLGHKDATGIDKPFPMWPSGESTGISPWYFTEDVCTTERCRVTLDYVDVIGASPQGKGSLFIQAYGPAGYSATWSAEYLFPIIVVTFPQIATMGEAGVSEMEGLPNTTIEMGETLDSSATAEIFNPSGIPPCGDSPSCYPFLIPEQ
jgi:hypothetical protein